MGLNKTQSEGCNDGSMHRAAECSAEDLSGNTIVATDVQLQCQRILACTARALANTPGGLRFKTGSRPWLDGLEVTPVVPVTAGKTVSAPRASRRPEAPFFGAFFHFATPVRQLPARA